MKNKNINVGWKQTWLSLPSTSGSIKPKLLFLAHHPVNLYCMHTLDTDSVHRQEDTDAVHRTQSRDIQREKQVHQPAACTRHRKHSSSFPRTSPAQLHLKDNMRRQHWPLVRKSDPNILYIYPLPTQDNGKSNVIHRRLFSEGTLKVSYTWVVPRLACKELNRVTQAVNAANATQGQLYKQWCQGWPVKSNCKLDLLRIKRILFGLIDMLVEADYWDSLNSFQKMFLNQWNEHRKTSHCWQQWCCWWSRSGCQGWAPQCPLSPLCSGVWKTYV